jgi:hypothetical protein
MAFRPKRLGTPAQSAPGVQLSIKTVEPPRPRSRRPTNPPPQLPKLEVQWSEDAGGIGYADEDFDGLPSPGRSFGEMPNANSALKRGEVSGNDKVSMDDEDENESEDDLLYQEKRIRERRELLSEKDGLLAEKERLLAEREKITNDEDELREKKRKRRRMA